MIQDEVRLTADLAQLDMSEEELRRALPAIEQMLTFFTAMDTFSLASSPEVSSAKAEGSSLFLYAKEALPFALWEYSYTNRPVGPTREEIPQVNIHNTSPASLVQLAGETRHSFIVVPNVL